jgi:NAD(P)-dependent dehydrogenase (short-subunit alcohol dehydrogenase family)
MPSIAELKEQQEQRPPQEQDQRPGAEHEMIPQPITEDASYRPSGKLLGKRALITGGDSGIGRAVSIAFAKEGADVAFNYLNEMPDASQTLERIRHFGRNALSLAGDIGDENVCRNIVNKVIDTFGGIDILVNNAAEQHPQESIEDVSAEQLERTFRTNIFAMFYLVKAALKHLKEGSAIINTTSVTAYRGSPKLLDYAATKGAIVAFTRSLSKALVEKGIRVNAVAPGPIWTPLIPSTFPAEKVQKFGEDVPMGRAGQPAELAPCYVFLASQDSSYMTGQVLHVNGGEIVNG